MKAFVSNEFRLSPTTITVKRGTKQQLDALGERRDSYDEIIRRLINENANYQKYIESLANKVTFHNEKTANSSIILNDLLIDFAYHIPIIPLDKDFRFMVTTTKITKSGKEIRIFEQYAEPKQMISDYLRIIEQIIRTHLDNLFKISEKHLFDLDWWQRQFKNLGLPNESFDKDIKFELIKMGFNP